MYALSSCFALSYPRMPQSILSLSASEAFCISGANDHDVRVWDCRGETWRLPAADVRAVEGSYPGS
eukprot:763138-Hanusia_phi.AAC.9